MSLEYIEDLPGVPKKETDLGNLTAQQIIDKIHGFFVRFEKDSVDFADGEFLAILVSYPVSMCSYTMTETLKLLISLIYFEKEPTQEEIEKEKAYAKAHNTKVYPLGVSFDELALVFDRSKATIHEAIKQKEAEAKAILQEARLKSQAISQAKQQALRELIEEEKKAIEAARKVELLQTEG